VAEELFYRADVGAPVEQVRRERVAKDMGLFFFCWLTLAISAETIRSMWRRESLLPFEFVNSGESGPALSGRI